MTLVNLPNLYCTPQDIVDLLGIEGTELRLDDHNRATGQQITVVTAGNLGDTSLAIAALQKPLLAGMVLRFDGGGLSDELSVTLTSTGLVGNTALSVNPLTAAIPVNAFAEDNGVTLYLAGLLTKACKYATAWVKRYCCNRYDDSQLALAWSVNEWATNYAARWVSKRLSRAVPDSIEKDYVLHEKELKSVLGGQLCIEDIGTRTSGWPFMSNVTVNVGYQTNKMRVEPQISEGTPTQYGQLIDWTSAFFLEL